MNKLKKLFAILTLVCFLFTLMPMSAFAETEIIANGECGESAIWTLDSEGILTISGTGEMYDYNYGSSNAPWHDNCKPSHEGLCQKIKHVVVTEGITSIGADAFCMCQQLETVYIANTVQEIGSFAFGYSNELKEINIPASVIEIHPLAFEQCIAMRDITVDDDNEFYTDYDGVLYDIGMKELILYPAKRSGEMFSIPEGVLKINSYAFTDNEEIVKLYVPETVNELSDCYTMLAALSSVHVSEKNEKYMTENGVLYNKEMTTLLYYPECKTDKEYKIPDGVLTIKHRSMDNSEHLEKLIIPKTLIEIEMDLITFRNFEKLNTFEVDENNKVYFDDEGVLYKYGSDSIELISYPYNKQDMTYTVLDGVKEIRNSLFAGRKYLETIILPDTVTSIDYNTFRRCTKLKSINIPEGITEIGGGAFSRCSNLQSIALPKSLKYLGTTEAELDGLDIIDVFERCTSLTDVYYAGSEEEWNQIVKGYAADDDVNVSLQDVNIHFNTVITNNPVSPEKSYIEVPEENYATSEIPVKIKYCDVEGNQTTAKSDIYFWITKDDKLVTEWGYSHDGQGTGKRILTSDQTGIIYMGRIGVDSNAETGIGIDTIGSYTINYSFTEPVVENGTTIASEPDGVVSVKVVDNHICGENATWTLNTDGVLKIEGVGEVTERTWGSRRDAIKTIVVEEGITALPREAFARLDNLNKIELPASLEIVGVSLLQSSDNLTEIKVVDDNEIFYTIDNVLYQKAENSSDITLVAYPAGKTDKRFVVPDEVTVIGEGALSYCDNIEELIIGANVRQIVDIGVHYDSSNLNSIVVDDKNSVFYSKDGVLYQYGAEGDILVSYPNNRVEKSFVVPDGVVEIHEHAFIGDNNLEKLTLSEGVVALGEGCFEDCASLKKLYIPKNAVPIGSHIFAFSIVLEDIYYGGTEEEWNQSFGNEFVWENAVIHFNATDIPSGSNSGTDSGSSSSGGGSYYVPSTSTQTSDDITVNNTNADVRVETSDVKVSVITNAKNTASKDSNIDIIGGEGCAVSVSAKDKQGNALEGFFTPVTVKIPIDSDVLKTVDNISQLTLAKVVTDETGNTSLVYMGGSYDTQTGVFAAYADESGDYVLVEDADVKKIELQIGNRTTAINGMDKTSDVAPRIIDNHTYVPLRYIAEILGCDVAWDDVERTVTIKHANITMKLVIDEKIDGYDVAAVIRENRTLVPLRYIAEQLGANVIWHPETQEIVVVK